MGATSVGQIGLDLVVNQNQFKKQMSGITSLAKKAGAALAAAFAVKKIADFGKQCLELGSDLQEVQNVVDVTFPHMSNQVDRFAKSAAQSFGLSETMAKRYTGTFGAMAKAFGFTEAQAYDMSTTLTGLAGDVASFYNISQDEAYTKLKSVFSGETETLKDLGIVMTQAALDQYALANGYGKTTQAMTEQEKVALRYAFVQSQLSTAQGDFARTSDSWANQTRTMSLQLQSIMATIGQGLINLFTPAIKVINSVLGKIATLANAFKSFTEMLTGNKSSGGSGIGSMAAEVDSGLSGAADSAGNLADNTASVGSAAKKAAKEMRALMGFDQINKLSEQDKSESGSGSSPGVSSGTSGAGADFGQLAQGETVVDNLSGSMQKLINRAKELAGLFRQGFEIGFGNSEKSIASIRSSILGIGRSLKDIATDSSVVSGFNNLLNAIVLNFGKIAGSIGSIGITIATNLVGGINKYLDQSKEYIKTKLASIFNVSADILNLSGDVSVALADVLSVLNGETAQQITADIIGMFSDGFLGATDLALKFARDIISTLTGPFVDNADKFKEAFENFLKPVSEVLSTLHKSVRETFERIGKVYDEHVKPMFDSFRKGFSEIVSSLLDGYNTYIAPVLDRLSKKFTETYNTYIQPVINKAVDLFGKLADSVKEIWEKTLQPFLNWIAKNIMPVIAPILEAMGNKFMAVMKTIGKAINGILDILDGIIDVITGVFTGNWDKAWKGVKKIFGTVWDGLVGLVKKPINTILGIVNGLLKGVEGMVNGIADALNTINIDLPDWLEELTGFSSIGFNIPHWTAPQIPYLAKGGYVKPNTPQLAMIGDNRHQGEVVAPEDKLQAMVDAAVSKASGHGGITREEMESIINSAVMRIVAALANMGFYLDGEQLARMQKMAQTGIDRRWNTVEVT